MINIGYVTLALQYGAKPRELTGAIEVLSTKIGLVLLVLGFMHFFNLAVFSRMRKRSLHHELHGPSSEPVAGAHTAPRTGSGDDRGASVPANIYGEPA